MFRSSDRRVPLLTTLLSAAALCLIADAVRAQPTELSGLSTDAVVFRDSDGIAHICTGSDRDTIFMQGYVHAQDRIFQMDTLRRTFSGTLAELVGQGALGSDVQFRTFGLRRAAEATLAAYQEAGLRDSLAELQAYTDGVNRYLENNPPPPEYAALELSRVAPWSVIDSLTIGKGLAFGLAFDLSDLDLTIQVGSYVAAGSVIGFDGTALMFEDTTRHAPFDPTISIPDAARPGTNESSMPTNKTIGAPDPRAVELAKQYRQKVADIPRIAKTLQRRAGDEGSNWWLVSGEKSESGHAMLANDPHLALNTPSTFYENHLISSADEDCGINQQNLGSTAEKTLYSALAGTNSANKYGHKPMVGLNGTGVSFAGVPGVVLGCNTEICWGATVNPMDVTDVYQEVLVLDPQLGVPVATIFDGQPEPLVHIPQNFDFNVVGDGLPDTSQQAEIGPLQGGLTLVVPRRNNGPIIQVDPGSSPPTALSVQYTGWGPTFELEAFRGFLRASNINEFVAALQHFDVGSQNFAYADIGGNIAYFTSAELPVREDLQTLGFPAGNIPPFLIRDGSHTLPHEWLAVANPQPQQALPFEILPFAEMPQVVNPEDGYIINANNDPVGNTLDNNVLNEVRPGGGAFYLSPGYVSLRVGRIGRMMDALLADGGTATAADLQQIQANNQLLDAELVAPFLIEAFANGRQPSAPAELTTLVGDPGIAEAISRLMEWDYSTPTGIQPGYDPGDDPTNLPDPDAEEIAASVAATIWSAFRGQIVNNVIDSTLANLGLGDVLPGNRSAYKAVAHHLMQFDTHQGVGASGINFFPGPAGLTAEQSRDVILLQSLQQALALLASDDFAPAFGGSTDQNDYRWGYLHRIELDHILGGPFSIPSAGGFQPVSNQLRGVARAGGYEAVDASGHSARADGLDDFMFGSGASRRFVGVLDPAGIQADEVIPGGTSGVIGSPHYASQLGRWLTNDYHPLSISADDVADDIVSTTNYDPACPSGPETLCFRNARFAAWIDWTSPDGTGSGQAVPFASDASGNFYFFDSENWEILVKVLDGCAFNDHFWVFASAATDVAWELTVEDTLSGETWSATNPLGQRSPAFTDTEAFATCP